MRSVLFLILNSARDAEFRRNSTGGRMPHERRGNRGNAALVELDARSTIDHERLSWCIRNSLAIDSARRSRRVVTSVCSNDATRHARMLLFIARVIRRNFYVVSGIAATTLSITQRSGCPWSLEARERRESDGESESSPSKVVDNGRSFGVNRCGSAPLLNYPRFTANCRGIRARSDGSPV